MLAETLFRVPRTSGLQILQRRGEHGAHELTSSRLCLAAGESARYVTPDEETVIILQQGRGTFDVDDRHWTASRDSVFTERASAVYLPPGRAVNVRAETPLEAILVSTPAPRRRRTSLREPRRCAAGGEGARPLHSRGSQPLRHRSACAPSDGRRNVQPAGPLEQLSAAQARRARRRTGARRGVPLPSRPAARIRPPDALLGGWRVGDARGSRWRRGLLPYGYHPVSAPPGYRLYYLWAMAGKERRLALHEDPAHKWIHDAPQ